MADISEASHRRWWRGLRGKIEVDEELFDEELRYLRTDIYCWEDAEPLTLRLTALDRFRAWDPVGAEADGVRRQM